LLFMPLHTIVIHGGAGVIQPSSALLSKLPSYHQAIREALTAGFYVLDQGGTSLDAVVRAVTLMEDNPLFNAGKGSVFTRKGLHEMDAAVMKGNTQECGAVAGVHNIRNPILLAREIMEYSGHVFLNGAGAEDFAKQRGLPTEPSSYFFSKQRFRQWEKSKGTSDFSIDHDDENENENYIFGTVGAVAVDKAGNIAAGTSTGGMTNKAWGRIGDSPIIGAGTYANNNTCGISCTGHGELFIRTVAAHDVSSLMEYSGSSLKDAMEKVIFQKLSKIGGIGGMIGVDRQGNGHMVFNSKGMYRGIQDSSGRSETAVF
jgi:beta-aspartyl-peptidase (threonine type)